MSAPDDHRHHQPDPQDEQFPAIDCNDAERKLSALLERASSAALTAREAALILSEAEAIGAACPGQQVAAKVESVRFALRGPRESETDRCRRLRKELEQISAVTPASLRRALTTAGFSGSTSMGLAETQQFVSLIRLPLFELKESFSARAMGEDRMKLLTQDLKELLAALPKVPSARRMVTELQASVEDRLGDLEGRRRLDECLRSLRELEQGQENWEALRPLEESFGADAWIRRHQEDERVIEVKRLFLRLRDLKLTLESLAALADEVDQSVERGEMSEALDALTNAWRTATEKRLRPPGFLKRSATGFVDRLRIDLDDVKRSFEADPKPTIDGLQAKVSRANQIIFWANRLFGADAEAKNVSAQAVSLQARLSEALRAATLDEFRQAFQRLTFAELGSYIEHLKKSNDPVILEWAGKIAAFADNYGALHDFEDDPDETILAGLENAAAELGQSPLTKEAGRRAWRYRQALRELESIEKGIEETAEAAPRLRARLTPILGHFPRWRRARDASARIEDLDSIRKIQDLVEEGDLPGASSVVHGIGDLAFRSQLEDAIAGLTAADDLVRRAEEVRPSLKETREPEPLGRHIREAVGLVLTFSDLERSSMASSAIRRFPAIWQAKDERMSEFFAGDVEEGVQRWVELAASASQTEEEVASAESLLKSWCENLAFANLDATVLHRRRVEIRVEALVGEGLYPDALRLLTDSARLFSLVDLQRREMAIGRTRAIQEFVSRGKEGPEELVNIALDHGLEEDLDRLIVEHFKETGDPGPLSQLAMADASSLRGFPVTSQLSQWCRLLGSQRLPELAESLAAASDPRSLAAFIQAACQDRAPAAQAYFVLTTSSSAAAVWPEGVREICQACRQRLQQRLLDRFADLGDWLSELAQRLKAEPPQPLPAETDDQLKAGLRKAFEEAGSVIQEAILQLEEKEDELISSHRWLKDLPPFPTLAGLASDFQQMLVRLRRDREQVLSLERSKNHLLNSPTEQWHELRSELQNIGPGSCGPVLRIRQVALLYFKNWTEVIKVARWLRDAHRYHTGSEPASPERLSGESLAEKRQKLSKKLRYDMRPGQDRFNLHVLLGRADCSRFMEELETMQRELDEAIAYREELGAAMVTLREDLSARLGALRSGAEAESRSHHLVEIARLLKRPTRSNRELLVFARQPPEAAHSKPAQAILQELADKPWYQLLMRAIEAVETLPRDAF